MEMEGERMKRKERCALCSTEDELRVGVASSHLPGEDDLARQKYQWARFGPIRLDTSSLCSSFFIFSAFTETKLPAKSKHLFEGLNL
jgi:hypothetical protein